jgi:hypothetical protein
MRRAAGQAALRAGVGLVELAGPDRRWLAPLWERPADDRVRIASTVLAARDLMTATLLTRDPSPAVRRALAAVDGLHAASMIGLALVSARYRRPALVSAAIATVLALTTTA